MIASRSPGRHWVRWLIPLAWVGASVAIVAAAGVLPPWATIALAVGVFAARIFLPHPDAACRPPERVTNGTARDR
jgi:hypothetical protein